jgi:serine phosphatase RsbU (regulator of sigma subunit)/ligand-binding sensor domain-containing protein
MIKSLFLVVLICYACFGYAQKKENFVFDHLNSDKGFPAKSVQVIRQAPNGQLWMLTDKGLLKYNGKGGKIYPYSKDSSALLPFPPLQLYIDRQGIIWIGYLEAAISSFDPATETFTHYLHSDKEPKSFPNGGAANFLEDSRGNLWIAVWGGGLSRFNKGTFETFVPDLKNPKTISTTSITDIAEQKDGTFLISCWEDGEFGGNAFLQTFDYKKKEFTKFPLSEYTSFSENEKTAMLNALKIVHFIYIRDNDNIWLGSFVGLIHVNTKHKTIGRVSGLMSLALSNHKYSLGNLENTTGYVVDGHKLWVSTSVEGIMTVDMDTEECSYIKYETGAGITIGSDNVVSSFKDREGNTWISTSGGGIDVYSPLMQQFKFKSNKQLNAEKANRQQDQSTIIEALNGEHSDYTYLRHGSGLTLLNRKTDSVIHIDTKALFEKKKIALLATYGNRLWANWNPGVPVFVRELDDQRLIINCGTRTFFYNLKTGASDLMDKGYFFHMMSDISPTGEFCFLAEEQMKNMIRLSTVKDPQLFAAIPFPEMKYHDEGVWGSKFMRFLGDDNWFVGGYNLFVTFNSKTKQSVVYNSRPLYHNLSDSMMEYKTVDANHNVWYTATLGLYKFDYRTGKSEFMSDKLGIPNEKVNSINIDKNGIFWIALKRDLLRYDPKTTETFRYTSKTGLNMGTFAPVAAQQSYADKVYIPNAYGLIYFNPDHLHIDRKQAGLFFSLVVINKDTLPVTDKDRFLHTRSQLAWNQNFITLEFGTDEYYSPGPKDYRYRLLGLDTTWYDNNDRNYVSYPNLAPASYTFQVVCENVFGVKSLQGNVSFVIEDPFWKRWWFISLLVVLGLIVIYLFVKYRERALNKQKEKLEQTVNERTQEIQHQHEIIQEKNKEVMDSIKYAQRIQKALLAHTDFMEENLPEHFVLFRPKDIVSGDFYWAAQSPGDKNLFFLAVCDCTGHGVPGAFMSLLNISFLNEAIAEKRMEEPGLILNYVREKLIQNISVDGSKDGMDGTLICFNKATGSMTYASANNKPLLIRNKQLQELPCDKMPIGIGEKADSFATHEVKLQSGDAIYFYTDGYADQFGGPKGKKFKYKPLNEILLSNSGLPAGEQKELLEENFVSWKGNLEQVDDVLMIGIRIS